ncbi:conserved oligomeric Golgi complex subunit 8, partial [Lecanoromycetidae sp. Uapishka_2]
MADPLYELLAPYFDAPLSPRPVPSSRDAVTTKYLNRLSTLPLASLTSSEPQLLAQSSHSTLLSLQSLSARSNNALVASADHLSSLRTSLPQLAAEAESLRNDIPKLDAQAVAFAERYSRSQENEVLDRRKRALLMARNVDRLSDILDLPTLLSSAISSATAQGASNTANYASALDLHSHIKRLHLLYQKSELVSSIYQQTEEAMQEMTSNLIASLRSQNIKLAAGMRTIGWLRRVAPEMDGNSSNREGTLGALFLVCRLSTLVSMLSALDPLRDLADQETAIRLRDSKSTPRKPGNDAWSSGQQTERYLKRYIEIFREQSFAIVSMHKSIFPSGPDTTASDDMGLKFKSLGLKSVSASLAEPADQQDDPLGPLPSALATFPLHLVGLLSETLKQYLPNVRDKSSRESLLTQVLYCAGSLGRLGGDFSLLLADLEHGDCDDDEEEDDGEWVEVMRKHRVLAGKLESLASGSGSGSVRGTKGLLTVSSDNRLQI